MAYHVYILMCADNTYYTGIAKDLNSRIEDHNGDLKGAKYTRGRRPVKLIYSKRCKDKSSALKREIEIKKLSRIDKEQLIKST